MRAPAGLLLAAAVLAAALTVPAALPDEADANTTTRAVSYLRGAQNTDGGFGAGVHERSSQLHTGWAALGLAAARRNPARVRRGNRSALAYLQGGVRGLTDTGELSRTILAVRASGRNARRFGGRNLVARLARRQRSSNGVGSWDGLVNQTAFAMLALRADGHSARSTRVRRGATFIRRQQRPDGGFGLTRRSHSDVDVTGAAIQALVRAGQRRSRAVRRAIAYLRRSQNADGGWGYRRGSSSNAQSTAFAIQGIVAAGRRLSGFRRSRTPTAYLRSLRTARGSIRYSRTSERSPVWVTAQALLGIERQPFPIPPRR